VNGSRTRSTASGKAASAVKNRMAGKRRMTGVAKEFRAVESKLNLLGQQYRGAREDATELRHNVDQLLERMASQLDCRHAIVRHQPSYGRRGARDKNPLNAIGLRLELLRARLGEPDHELSGEIDILSKEVLRLDRVVKTFLDFSRPLDVHLQDLDLGVLAREVTEFVTPQSPAGQTSRSTSPRVRARSHSRRLGSAQAGGPQSGKQCNRCDA